MKTIIALALSIVLSACTTVADDGAATPDAGTEPTVDAPAGGGDEVPGPETAAHACRGGKDSGGDYFECRKSDIASEAVLNGVTYTAKKWVGECPSEGGTGYWVRPIGDATLSPSGTHYRIYLKGTATNNCRLTVSQCSNKDFSPCWMQFGENTYPGAGEAGPYRWCDSGGCAMELQRNPEHTPIPKGNR